MNEIRARTTGGLVLAFVLAFVAASEACSHRTSTGPELVTRIQVSPQTATLDALGASVHFQAVAYSSGGRALGGATFTWRAADPSIARVATAGGSTADGTATALAQGTTRIVVSSAGVEGSSLVVVAQKVASVSVQPQSATLNALGATVDFTATPVDVQGNPIPGSDVQWSSSAPSVVSVDSQGRAKAVAEGTAVITARANDVSTSSTVTVDQVVKTVELSPDTIHLIALGTQDTVHARALDPGGSDVPDAAFTWTSSDSGVVTVEGGIVTAVGNGRAVVTATAQGTVGTAQVEVRQEVTQVILKPDSVRFDALRQTVDLSPIALDAQGNEVPDVTYTWSSSNATVAGVSDAGRVTSQDNGTAVVSARVDAAMGEVHIVVAQVVRRLTLDPQTVALASLGATQRLDAVAMDGGGSPVLSAGVSFTSSAPSVATVASTGVVRAVENGSATVSASSNGVSATAQVRVRQVVDRVVVTPAVSPVVPGNTIPLAARALDALGSDVEGATFSWRSPSPGVVGVSDAGVATAVTLGTVAIECQSEGVTGTAAVNVVAASWPNRPAGLAVLSDNPFDALASDGWSHLNRAAESRIASDSTAPLSQPRVLEDVYPIGFSAKGVEPAVDWIDVEGANEVYVGFWFKASDPWQGHASGINKIMFFWQTANNGNVVFTMRQFDDGSYHLQAYPEGEPSSGGGYLAQNVHQASISPGRWYRFEMYVKAGTAGDGIIRWWQDGVLLGDYTGVTYNSGGFGEIQIAPTWGGLGGPDKHENDFFRFDQAIVLKR